jgi:hypothetical protein
MASFLSIEQKQSIDGALDRLHDTFAKQVYVYIEKESDVSADGNYNALYGGSKIQNVASYSKVLTRHSIMARVKYFPDQTEGQIPNSLPDSKGKIRLKVLPDDYEKIKICTKIEVGEYFYVVDGDAAIEGMFSDNYYTVYFKREN